MEDVIFRFHETKKDDPILTATNLYRNIINIHPFDNGNGLICHLILAHVLMQMKFCLFPVILSSFHRRGRRHYIRAGKMFDRKSSMLYTINVKPLIHCRDNLEQDAKIINQFDVDVPPGWVSEWTLKIITFLGNKILCIVTEYKKFFDQKELKKMSLSVQRSVV